jgi:hypothetical protein
MLPQISKKHGSVPRAPKAPAAPPIAAVVLDSLPTRIQREIGTHQRREAIADKQAQKKKKNELLSLQRMCARVIIDKETPWTVAQKHGICNKKLTRWVNVNNTESCMGSLENFCAPPRGHPSLISDAGVQEIKEVLLTRDLEGTSITYVPSVRKSAAVVMPGYDPSDIENSFAHLVTSKVREETLQRNPNASAQSLKPPSGSTFARLAKKTEVKKVKVKSHSKERRAAALVDGYNPVSLASVMLILFCSMTGISLPEVESAEPAAFETEPRFLGSISRSLIMNVDKSTSFLGLSQDETLMIGPGSVAALAELSRSVTSVGTEEKRRCVSYTVLVNAAGLLVAFFSHIKDHNFSGTGAKMRPATITLLEGNVLGGPKCFLILNGTQHASSDEEEARMMLRAVFDLAEENRDALGMPRVHVPPAGGTARASSSRSSKGGGSSMGTAGGTARASGSSKGRSSNLGTAGGTVRASGSSKGRGSMGTAGGTAGASGSSKAGGSMGIAGGTAGSGAERKGSNNLASNESIILQIIPTKFREQRKFIFAYNDDYDLLSQDEQDRVDREVDAKLLAERSATKIRRAAREQLDPDEYEDTPPTSDEEGMWDDYPTRSPSSMGPGAREVIILEGGGGSRCTAQNTSSGSAEMVLPHPAPTNPWTFRWTTR